MDLDYRKAMRRLFKRGERVKNARDGKVMEVVKYIKGKQDLLVECAWFDLNSKELRTFTIEQNQLLKAS